MPLDKLKLSCLVVLSMLCCGHARGLKGAAASPCPTKPDISGHLDVASFVQAMESGGTEFLLCPGVVYNETVWLHPKPKSPYTIVCADESEPCAWRVTVGSHIIYNGTSAISLTVRGITFTGASETSIEMRGNSESSIEFSNCTWNGNDGEAVIHIGNKNINVSDSSNATGARASTNVQVSVVDCLFEDNKVTQSIVYSDTANMYMKNCEFDANEAEIGIISLFGGSHSMDVIRFEGNDVAASGIIYANPVARLNATNICGFSNTVGITCNGTFYDTLGSESCVGSGNSSSCAPQCVPYDECTIYDCVSSLAALKGALIAGGDIEICSGTTFDLSTLDGPLKVGPAAVSLRCTKDCVFAGGNEQFRILDGATTVSFERIRFTGSETLSIRVETDPSEPSLVTFASCEWSGHRGKHVVVVDPPGLLEANEQLQAYVEISESHFSNNNVEEYLVTNKGVGLWVSTCVFRGNVGAKGAVGALGGETTIGDGGAGERSGGMTTIEGNQLKKGMFFVGLNSTVFTADNVCGKDNVVDNSCNGTFYEASNPTECRLNRQNSEACKETCIPANKCDASECYSTLSTLVEAVASTNGGSSFIVCPGSDFILGDDDTLLIDKDETILRCGETGERSNRCSFIGGNVQVQINGTASGIRMEGITFVGSSNLSIAAIGNGDSSATFSDCEFSGHAGEAVIIVFHQDDTPEGSTKLPAMRVAIDWCVFDDNLVEMAPITNLQGEVLVTNTTFNGNTGLVGAGAVVSYSSLSVSDSCFVANTGNVSGSILLSGIASQRFDQKENFGDKNEVVNGNCTDIFTTDGGFSCDAFESNECLVTLMLTSASPSGSTPTSSPVPSSPSSREPSSPTSAPTPVGPCFAADEWETFFDAVRDSPGEETFTVCKDTVINMTDMEASKLAPLLIKASGITIRCGSKRRNGCVLSGGTTHILLSDNVNVRVRGFTMEFASNVSVSGSPSIPFSIEFEDCEWKNNTGVSVVDISAMDNSTVDMDSTDNSTVDIGATDNSTVDIGATGNSSMGIAETDNSTSRIRNAPGVMRREQNAENDNFFVCDQCLFEGNNVLEGIISASGTSLVLDAVVFRGNAVNGSVVSVANGSVVLQDSCMDNTESNDALVAGDPSKLNIQNIYFTGSNGRGCSGYLEADGNCVEPTTASSCIAEEVRCYSDWLDLSDAVSSAGEGRIFTICSGETLDVGNAPPIEIKQSKTTIRCGVNGARDSQCSVSGGGVQFQIGGTPTDILFSGITFSGSSIVAVNAAGGRSSRAQIVDCIFEKMATGQAALLVYFGDVPSSARNRRRLVIGDYNEPSDESMTVEVSYCSFFSNSVELAAIANLKGTLVVSNCDFNQNVGSVGAIGEWFSGSTSLSTSCFTDNTGELAGAVLVDGDSYADDKNYGDGNVATSGSCKDLVLAKTGASGGSPTTECVEFVESKCASEAPPTQAPTQPPTLPGARPSPSQSGCIGNWDDLVASITTNFTAGVENILTLCPDKVIKVGDSPILLDQADGDLWIECGQDGRLRDNCVIRGGEYQIRIAGAAIKVTFRGVTFENSKVMSIVAAGDAQSTAAFDECQWTGHSGQGVVLIYNEALGQEYDVKTPIDELPLSGNSMSVSFSKCSFVSNPVKYAPVSIIGGTSTISSTSFKEHFAAFAATVVARRGAVLTLERCCFVQNDSNLPGAVLLMDESKLGKNDDNYGYDNRVGVTDCTDIWTVSPLEKCEAAECPGVCSTFDASECSIPGFEFEAPSSSPSSIQFTTPSEIMPSSAFELVETTLFDSGYYVQNLVLAAVVTVLGFVAFFYCKTQHEQKAEGRAKILDVESAPAPEPSMVERFQQDDFMMPLDGVILDPDTLNRKGKPKKKISGLFSRPPKKNETAERQPMISSAAVSSPTINTYSSPGINNFSYRDVDRLDRDDGDESRSSDDESDDMILS